MESVIPKIEAASHLDTARDLALVAECRILVRRKTGTAGDAVSIKEAN